MHTNGNRAATVITIVLFYACFISSCADKQTGERYDPTFVDESCNGFDEFGAVKAAEYSAKCVESGGRGIRSTEDWINSCQLAAKDMFCRREMMVNFDYGWKKPCRLAAGNAMKMCVIAGYDNKR